MFWSFWSWSYRDVFLSDEEHQVKAFEKLEQKPIIVNDYYKKHGVYL